MNALGVRRPGKGARWLLPLLAVASIAALDVAHRSRSWSTPVTAALDEPAHLLTALLVWVAVIPRHALRRWLPWVLVGSVAIDLDHLPLYLGRADFLVDGGRPPSHSLTTVAVLAVLALLTPWHRPFGGLAVGVLLHFLRDLATGPGIPLGWPMVDVSVHVPYVSYAAVLASAALIATVRELIPPRPRCRDGSRAHHPPPGDVRRRRRSGRASTGDDGRVDQGSCASSARRRIRRTDGPDLPGRGAV